MTSQNGQQARNVQENISRAPPAETQRLALANQTGTHLIRRLLRETSAPSTLIVCASRQDFLIALQESAGAESDHETEAADSEHHDKEVNLTTITIQLIALSRLIRVVYVPALQHLRAYLSTYQTTGAKNSIWEKVQDARMPTLAIWGLVNMHRSTSGFSAQELSRSLSLAVETAALARQALLIAEPPNAQSLSDDEVSYWQEEIPLLGGSVRVEGDRRMLASQAVELGAVMKRWCSIGEEEFDEGRDW